MKRRDFMKKSLVGVAAVGASGLTNLSARAVGAVPRWYKGNIHCHTQWSDGLDLPEVVVDGYKKHGYDFLSITDHNILHNSELRFVGFCINGTPTDPAPFQGESSFWKKISDSYAWPNLVDEHIRKAQELFGQDSVRILDTKDGRYARMKTEEELRTQFAEPGKFLLIPGFEMTAQNVHVNLINVDKDFFMDDPSIKDLVVKLHDKAQEFYADATAPYLFMVNHPLWQYYNIQPSYLFARPEIRFIEILNNNTDWAYLPEAWTPEQLWDIVNAYRAKNEQPPLYATGTDDSHGVYRPDYLAYHSWTRVYADSLETSALFNAMNRGRSYISTGLDFAEIAFDGKTLSVKLDPETEGRCVVEFYGAKKDYDETFKVIETGGDSANTPKRSVECWSKEIGRVFETAEGLEASYTLKPDDLFVRAKARRVGAGCVNHGSHYKVAPLTAESAWTQPYRSGESF